MIFFKKFLAAILVFGCFALGSSAAYSQSDSSRKAMIERHEQMAKMHQKMVKCLKSKKSIEECRSQMKDDCPMMQGGGLPDDGGRGARYEGWSGLRSGIGTPWARDGKIEFPRSKFG